MSFARPQPMGRIWKIRLEPYRTGGLQDLIVDKDEFALIELHLPFWLSAENRELSFSLLLLNFRKVRFRQGEYRLKSARAA